MLAFKKIGGKEMRKFWLGVDWGDVLIKFNPKPMEKILHQPMHKIFVNEFLRRHDSDELHLWTLYAALASKKYFTRDVPWEEFHKIYSDCVVRTHQPMYQALLKLKKRGVVLVSITDNNHFCFSETTRKCPEIFDLFRCPQTGFYYVLSSHFIGALKKSGQPYRWVASHFGLWPEQGCFVDNTPVNVERFVKWSEDPESGFLYNIKSKKNHAEFLKFLEYHFPAKN